MPASGVRVEVSNPGSSPEIVNDIGGLSLLSLEFTGFKPFRLSGQAIAFSSRSALTASATAGVTNALDIALPAGENVVNNTGAGRFALAGPFSGADAKARNATQYRVEGEGRMEVEAAKVLGRRAAVYLATTATLRLDGDQKVKELYVNGVRQPDGKYAATASKDVTALSCLEGPGTLTVGGGVLLLVR